MRKRLGIVALVVALALTIAVPAALARGGPYGMFRGSVWVEAQVDGYPVDIDHIVFNAREGRGNQDANGHLFAKSSGSKDFDHRVDFDWVQTTGLSPCQEIELGDPTDPHGLCAMAGGFYSGPIDGVEYFFTLVCQETQYGGDDTISFLLLWSFEEYWFDVVGGSYSFH